MATRRNAISTLWSRSSLISVSSGPVYPSFFAIDFMRQAASSTTIDQPMPMRSRLPPVMLARASGAYFSGLVPAFEVKTKSTAYSGRTAIRARTARARPAETSSWRTSAAQARRKAAPTTASPKMMAAIQLSGWVPVARRPRAGRVDEDRQADRHELAPRMAGRDGGPDLHPAHPKRTDPPDPGRRSSGRAEYAPKQRRWTRPDVEKRSQMMALQGLPTSTGWRQKAACRGVDPEIFHPSEEEDPSAGEGHLRRVPGPRGLPRARARRPREARRLGWPHRAGAPAGHPPAPPVRLTGRRRPASTPRRSSFLISRAVNRRALRGLVATAAVAGIASPLLVAAPPPTDATAAGRSGAGNRLPLPQPPPRAPRREDERRLRGPPRPARVRVRRRGARSSTASTRSARPSRWPQSSGT